MKNEQQGYIIGLLCWLSLCAACAEFAYVSAVSCLMAGFLACAVKLAGTGLFLLWIGRQIITAIEIECQGDDENDDGDNMPTQP